MKDCKLIPILIISPYFAPQTHAAMFRVHKLVKYLPKYGYKPIVLTTDINYLYNENFELLKELPDCVEIVRTRYIEPSLRGLRMAFGGKDRTFAAVKPLAINGCVSSEISKNKKVNKFKLFFSHIYSMIVNFLYNMPDAHWTWTLSSRKTAEAIIKKYDIQLMYTTANPYSHLNLAARLKDKFGLKWLADFRDPCGYGYKHSPGNIFGLLVQKKIIHDAINKSNCVTGLAESYKYIFSDNFGLPENKFHFIPTGLDDSYLCAQQSSELDFSNHVVFSGEVMKEQGGYIFKVLNELALQEKKLEITFIGRKEINKPIIDALISSVSNWRLPVNYIDHMPQKKLYQILLSAKASILAPGTSYYWWNNFAKMVDYIALGVPVIADVPVLSEARKELSRASLGFFLEYDGEQEDAARLNIWLKDFDGNRTNNDYRKRYLASTQVAEFARLFDDLYEQLKNE